MTRRPAQPKRSQGSERHVFFYPHGLLWLEGSVLNLLDELLHVGGILGRNFCYLAQLRDGIGFVAGSKVHRREPKAYLRVFGRVLDALLPDRDSLGKELEAHVHLQELRVVDDGRAVPLRQERIGGRVLLGKVEACRVHVARHIIAGGRLERLLKQSKRTRRIPRLQEREPLLYEYLLLARRERERRFEVFERGDHLPVLGVERRRKELEPRVAGTLFEQCCLGFLGAGRYVLADRGVKRRLLCHAARKDRKLLYRFLPAERGAGPQRSVDGRPKLGKLFFRVLGHAHHLALVIQSGLLVLERGHERLRAHQPRPVERPRSEQHRADDDGRGDGERTVAKRAGVPYTARELTARQRVQVGQQRKKVHARHKVVKDKHIVEGEPRQQSDKHRLFGYRQSLARPPHRKQRQRVQRGIQQERRYAAGNKPVEELVVRAVKPLLLVVHAGVVIFVEDKVKVLLPPPGNRPLHAARNGHGPDVLEARNHGGLRERQRGDAAQHRTFPDERRVARDVDAAGDQQHRAYRAKGNAAQRAMLAAAGEKEQIDSGDDEADRKAEYRAARFGKEDTRNLQYQRDAVERLERRFVALRPLFETGKHIERHKHVDEQKHGKVYGVAEGRVGARAALGAYGSKPEELHKRPQPLRRGDRYRHVKKLVPQPLRGQDRAGDDKPCKEMHEPDVAQKRQLHQNPEDKVLAGDKREEEVRHAPGAARYDKRDKQRQKKGRNGAPAQIIGVTHSQDTTTAATVS